MRILAVTPYYAPEGGGLERYAATLLAGLAGRGHSVHVVSHGPMTGTRTHDGVLLDTKPPVMRVGNAPVDWRLPTRIREAVRKQRPDVVWAHSPVPFPADVAARVAHREAVPFALTYHAGRLHGSSPRLEALAWLARNTVEKGTFDRAERLMAVSPFVRDHALEHHRHRTSVVPPGVDAERFCPRGETQDEILFVGPLSNGYRWKGLDVLLEAWEKVRPERPYARLHLVGAGDRSEELQEKATKDANLRVSGRLPEEGLIEAYRRARMLVLPSTSDAEAFGMVLAEANACGTPVIGSRIGGIPDFIQHGSNGLLVDPGDPDELAQAIKDLIDDPGRSRTMGMEGRRLVEKAHDWRRLTERAEHVLVEASGAG